MIANEFITNTFITGKANDGKFETSWLVEPCKSSNQSLIDSIFDASDYDSDSAATDFLRPVVAAAVSQGGTSEVLANLDAVAQTAAAMIKAATSLKNSADLAGVLIGAKFC